jgi:hypothetical protein
MRERVTLARPMKGWPTRLRCGLDLDQYGREAVFLACPGLGRVRVAYRDHTEPCCESQGFLGGECCSDCLGTGHTHPMPGS